MPESDNASQTMCRLKAQDLTKNNLTIKRATNGCQARDTRLITLLKIASIFKNIINSILNKKYIEKLVMSINALIALKLV